MLVAWKSCYLMKHCESGLTTAFTRLLLKRPNLYFYKDPSKNNCC